MLVGLLFAAADAEDRPGMLAATLPFGAATLLEYQARLLQANGAGHVIVVVQRVTAELTGALARIGHRGLTIDVARSAADVLARLHPLAQIVMLSDALATTEGVIRLVAEGAGDALLVVPDGHVSADSFERLGGGLRWAGVARLTHARMGEVAALPSDYDLQSTLLRAAEQAGARHIVLAEGERRLGHGVERRAGALEERGRAMLAASLALRSSWFERVVVRPIARYAIPLLARRMTASATVMTIAGVVALAGLAATLLGFAPAGLPLILAALIGFDIAGALALFRDERSIVRIGHVANGLVAVSTAAVLAAALGGVVAPLLAAGGVIMGTVAERAARPATRRLWWGAPGGYVAVLAIAVLAGHPLAALALAGAYAAITLSCAVEALRREA